MLVEDSSASPPSLRHVVSSLPAVVAASLLSPVQLGSSTPHALSRTLIREATYRTR